jgi:hypothetical protein
LARACTYRPCIKVPPSITLFWTTVARSTSY